MRPVSAIPDPATATAGSTTGGYGPASMTESRLVVGVDMSDEAAVALTAALRLGHRLGSDIIVVHAVGLLEEGGYRPPPAIDELLAAARAAAGVAVDDVHVDVQREDGPAADVLIRIAARERADMLIVGRRGSGGAPGPLGSVSEAVLARATSPVLVVPAAG
jgi:nucleotide-binding universal stress UspA family protein